MKIRSEIERRTMTVPEAATALGIGRSAGYEAARRGELPTIRIGRRVLVPVVALEKILAEAHGDPKEGELRSTDR